jgi:hypothetical protein
MIRLRMISSALRLALMTVLFCGLPSASLHAATALPAFAYRKHTLSLSTADGKPVPGASVYGFCREYGLLSPRPDVDEGRDRDDGITYDLGTTASDGTLSVIVPPGRWAFFAAGALGDGRVIAAWSDYRAREPDEAIALRPTLKRHWT